MPAPAVLCATAYHALPTCFTQQLQLRRREPSSAQLSRPTPRWQGLPPSPHTRPPCTPARQTSSASQMTPQAAQILQRPQPPHQQVLSLQLPSLQLPPSPSRQSLRAAQSRRQ